MADTNYTVVTGTSRLLSGNFESGESNRHCQVDQTNTNQLQIVTALQASPTDMERIYVAVFR